jgi:hypothetical protein
MRDGRGEGSVERGEDADLLWGAEEEALGGGRPEEIGDLGGEFRGEEDHACGFEGARGAEGEFGGEEGCDECAVGAGEGLCRCCISRMLVRRIGNQERGAYTSEIARSAFLVPLFVEVVEDSNVVCLLFSPCPEYRD